MCTRLLLEPNIEVDVPTRPRSEETAQVNLDTETVHRHKKKTDRDRTCGATTQQKRWQGLTVHSLVSSCMSTFGRYPLHAVTARKWGSSLQARACSRVIILVT